MALPQDTREINPIRSIDDIVFSGADMLNQGDVAEGQQTPPMQHGFFRVQVPENVKIISQTYDPATLSSIFVIGWTDVNDSADGLNQAQVAHYKIYAKLALSSNPNPTLVGEAEMSPCYVSVVSDTAASDVTFFIRPYLTNGQTVPLERCPTVTGSTPTPFYTFTSGNISVIIDASRPIGGGTSAGLGVVNNSTGRQVTLAGGFIVGFNDLAGTKRTFSLGFGGAGQGLGFLYDGTNAGGFSGVGDRIALDGGQGHIRAMGPGGGNPGLLELSDSLGTNPIVIFQNVTSGVAPAGATTYLEVTIGGTAYRILAQQP